MDNYLDSSRKIIDENYDDYRLVDFELLASNLKVYTFPSALAYLCAADNTSIGPHRKQAHKTPTI